MIGVAMNFFLVNTTTVKPLLAPIGLLYLTGYLRANGFNPFLIDFNMIDGIADFKAGHSDLPQPDLIGFSIRNIDSTQWKLEQYFLPDILRLIEQFRSLYPGTPIVLGGAGFSIEPLEIMRLTRADFGVVGEGEGPLLELIKSLSSGWSYTGIPGLVYKSGLDYKLNPPRQLDDSSLASLPFQAIDAIDYQHYFKVGGMASVQTKRGCALNCSYCTCPTVEGRSFRFISPERVVDEIEFLVNQGYDYFHFTDSVFNFPKRHAINVCKEIIKRRIFIKWHAYTSPFKFDETLAELSLEAGCDGFLFGADSCSDVILKEYGKNFRQDDIYAASAICRKLDIEHSFHILFGPPGETMGTVKETFRVLDDIRPTAAFLTQGIRVYKDTPIYRKLVRLGKISPDQSLLEPYYYFSEELPDNFGDIIRRYAKTRDFCFSDMTVESPSTNPEIERLYRNNVQGPCWRILKELRMLKERR
jgi:radical SAM superfamily enzyme YgiQ (UPF0313 family)